MTFSLLRLTELYPKYINELYLQHPQLSSLSFTEQTQFITEQSTELSSAHIKELNVLGIPAVEIIVNAEIAQQTYKTENNLSSLYSQKQTVIHQINKFKPEVVWIDATLFLEKSFINEIRKSCKSVKKIVGHICAPYNLIISEGIKELDIIFTCTPCMQKYLADNGAKKSVLIYHGFYVPLLKKLHSLTNQFNNTQLVFTGSLYTGVGLHKKRIEYLETIIKNNFDIEIYGNLETRKSVLQKQGMYYLLNFTQKIGLYKWITDIDFFRKYNDYANYKVHYYSKKLINKTKPPVFGLKMFQVLQKADICFNIHGEIAGNCAGNIRMFEATGVGTCLLTDYKENLSELFIPDQEIVTYNSVNECIEKIKWLIENPNERKKIALAGQAKTIKEHNTQKRVEQIVSYISDILQ